MRSSMTQASTPSTLVNQPSQADVAGANNAVHPDLEGFKSLYQGSQGKPLTVPAADPYVSGLFLITPGSKTLIIPKANLEHVFTVKQGENGDLDTPRVIPHVQWPMDLLKATPSP